MPWKEVEWKEIYQWRSERNKSGAKKWDDL